MKKTLSLILAVMMLLSCLTVPAFAGGHDPGVVIAGTPLTADDIVSNTAITSGTVTYTAASDGNPAKLILENAVISGPCTAPIISVYDINLVIELIGNNQVTAGSNAAVISVGAALTITGSGSLIIHGNGGEGSVAIGVTKLGGITLSEGCKMVGSTSATETVIDTMSEVTFDADKETYMVGEAVAQTVAIYNSNAASGKSGSSTITATKEEPEFAYTIVIPTATELTESAHENIQLGGNSGKASITVTTPSAKTNVYYTVDLSNATLTDGTNNIATTYAYAQGGDYAALTGDTKVTVYEGGTVKDSTVQVTADDTAWAAAPAGTYTASVVFNFAAEEAEAAVVTIADILDTLEGYFPAFNGDVPANAWTNADDANDKIFTCDRDSTKYLCILSEPFVPTATELTKTSDKVYSYVNGNVTLTFNLDDNGVLENIVLSGADEGNGTYTWPAR